MAFFKTKKEREIMAQMEREEQLQVFNDQIKELKAKREEYATIAYTTTKWLLTPMTRTICLWCATTVMVL